MKSLESIGMNMGMAFQLVDDLLDLTSTQQLAGKPVVSDLREGKVTLPVILMLQRTDDTVRGLVREAVTGRVVTAEAWGTIRAELGRHGTLDATFERAVRYAREAQRQLTSAFPPSSERDALVALCDYVISRDR